MVYLRFALLFVYIFYFNLFNKSAIALNATTNKLVMLFQKLLYIFISASNKKREYHNVHS